MLARNQNPNIVSTSRKVLATLLVLLAPSIVTAQEEPPREPPPQEEPNTAGSEDPPAEPSSEPTPDSTDRPVDEQKKTEPKDAVFDVAILAPNGKPVVGATVEIPALKLTVTTGAEGAAQLQVPFGTMEVSVTATGFSPQKETIKFDEALAQAGHTIFMTYDLGEVVVTGVTHESLVAESPVKTQVIEREAIERKGAANLAQALKHTTGVRLENNCQNCNFTQVRLNGLDGRYSQILINGRPVFSTLAGVYGLEQIPSEMIDRIEIVKGGGSALYGGGAVAGVINVITKRPDKSFGSLRAGGFTLGEQWGGHSLGGNVGLVNEGKTLALALSGSLNSREAWDGNGDDFSDIGMFRQHSFSGDLFWDPIPGGTLTLRLQTLGERRRGGDNLDMPEFDAAVSEGGTTLRQGGELRWRHALRSGLSYELGYSFAHTSRDSYYGGGGDVAPPSAGATVQDWEDFWAAKSGAMSAYGHTRNPVHFGDALLHVPFSFLGEMMFTAGAQVQVEQLTDSFPSYSRQVEETYSDVAGLAELDWHPAEWNETILGVRVGKNSEIDTAVATPRLAVTFKPLPWLRTRTSFSTGYRAPQVFDEDLHITIIGGEGAIVKNDPGLTPEMSYGGAQQIELTFALSPSWSVKTGLNGFITYLTNTFVLDDIDDPGTPGEREFVRTNRGETLVYGGELEVSLAYLNAFNLRAGWVLERSQNSERDPDFNAKPLFRTPEMYGFVEASGKLPWGFEPFTAVDITGPMKVPHYSGYVPDNVLEDTPWFFDWDLGLSYHLPIKQGPKLKLSFIARNILDSFQSDLDKGGLRDAGYVYGPALPRSLWFELKGDI
ncbi:MAG: TonB-dependent receptor [Armatimonadetes bacterium]|nr:TonB-dependent receptor [Armatimonadota bacterium]